MPTQYRQGDILLVKFDVTPLALSAARPVPRVNSRLILAYGEVTGHAHAIDSAQAELLQDPRGRIYLRTGEACHLTHEEHAPIHLEEGVYQVVHQREYLPGRGARSVRD